MKKILPLAIILTLSLSLAACGSNNNVTTNSTRQAEQSATPSVSTQAATKVDDGSTNDQKAAGKKIRITVGETVLTATSNNSKTTQEFIELLPLTLSMNDLFNREYYAHLPKAILDEGKSAACLV